MLYYKIAGQYVHYNTSRAYEVDAGLEKTKYPKKIQNCDN